MIYAFSGRLLGFYDGRFIYSASGDPVGAADPKSLGKDAASKKWIDKADKQPLPAKQPKNTANPPRLKNAYRGGSLRDVF